MTSHADMAPAVEILDSAVHPLDGGAFVVAHFSGVAVSGLATGPGL